MEHLNQKGEDEEDENEEDEDGDMEVEVKSTKKKRGRPAKNVKEEPAKKKVIIIVTCPNYNCISDVERCFNRPKNRSQRPSRRRRYIEC